MALSAHPGRTRRHRDVFDGGDGTDTLGYSGRRRGLVVDLARTDPHAGSRAERDLLQGLEAVGGGNGNDRLLGNDRAISLWGGDGDDLVVGRGGDDGLYVGPGSNRACGDAATTTSGSAETHTDTSSGSGSPAAPTTTACSPCSATTTPRTIARRSTSASSMTSTSCCRRPTWLRPPLASYSTEVVDCEAPECRLRLDVRLARSPSRRRPQLKGLLLGRVTETVPNRSVVTLTAYLSDRGVRLLRRYRALLIRISLKKVSPDDPRVAEGPAGAYLTRLLAPAP